MKDHWWGYGDGIRTIAVDEFIVLGQTLRMRHDANGDRIYYDKSLSAIENYMRFLCRDRDTDPKELTPEQKEQLLRLRREMIYTFGK
ncbi:hypothetical protein HYV89_02085 [Candidatus Woesearchaeota archaeon]|nr:hypothetical protein [Candidatus Woesearchaeota archaeon]